MTGRTVPVTAEWALWGKDTRDAGYHLLDCSAVAVSAENFDQVLTRYSPGTLESLPQVTISWFLDSRSGTDYLAIAIHDAISRDGTLPERAAGNGAEPGTSHISDRDTMRTSYFCVPFRELAQVAVSYTAMYEGFRAIRLPEGSRKTIPAELAAAEPGPRPGEVAMRVAALLLTGKPVCILRADQVGLGERLLFLDAVASLLPYGIRSRLSASTWASSTYQNHRLRLFFASAPRNRDDHLVTWGRAEPGPIGDDYNHADDYLNWLQGDPQHRATRLAHETQPMSFDRSDVLKLLERMGIHSAEVEADAAQPLRAWAQSFLSGHKETTSIEDLLRSCAQQLEAGNPRPGIAELQQHLGDETTAEERRNCQQIIKNCRLLREDLPVSMNVRAEFYAALLPLAFGTPLTYESYCQVEDCAGNPAGHLPPAALLLAMDSGRLDGKFMRSFIRLLRLQVTGYAALGPLSGDNPLTPRDLANLVVNPALRRHHARIVWDALRERSEHLDRRAMQQFLRERQYFAAELERRYPDETEYQVTVLSVLLRLAYGRVLGRSEIQEVLNNSDLVPTAALLGTIQINMDSSSGNRRRLKRQLLENAGLEAPGYGLSGAH